MTIRTEILTLMAAAMLCGACGEEESSHITFQTVAADKTVRLSNDDVPPTCSVNLRLEEATETSGHRGEVLNETVMNRLLDRMEVSMQVAADAFAEDYTQTYLKTMLPLYNQDRADTTKRAWYEYHYIISATTQLGSKGVLAYLANIDRYEGGANGTRQLVAMNFDEATGRLITLNDVFLADVEKPLSALLLKALKAKTGLATLKALHGAGYLRGMDIYPPDNFILGTETVTFVYNPDEIAPFDLGSTELTLTYEEMRQLLNPSFQY